MAKTKEQSRRDYLKWYTKKRREDPDFFRSRNRESYRNHRKRRLEQSREYRYSLAGQFKESKASAKDRNLEWTITKAQYEAVRAFPCVYCGAGLPPTGGALDRIDNSIGYTFDNVLPCCRTCNRLRCNWMSVAEMKLVAWVLMKVRGGKLWEK